MTSTTGASRPLATRFSRVHDAMAAHVARGHMPGATYALCVGGEARGEAIGERRVGGGAPMTRDTIFRVASMTKPMAAAVGMMLVEEGVLALDAPVDRWLPELANRRVLRRIDGPLDALLRERLFAPLGMNDTDFWGPPYLDFWRAVQG
jgi:CubicO group peptidase (beta-lactamase class C family)